MSSMRRYNSWRFLSIALFFVCGLSPWITSARTVLSESSPLPIVGKISQDEPYVSVGVHNIGKIGLTVSNQGHFGTGFISGVADPLTGGPAPSCIYPYPGRLNYLFAGAFWIGAIVDRDTLVSVGADGWHFTKELWPDPWPRGKVEYHTISDPDDSLAVSEQDYIAIYTDTVTRPSLVEMDPFDNRPHIPLNIEITQRSYAWSYSYAEDFVLFDYSIKNIGRKPLKKVCMGIYVDGDVTNSPGGAVGYADDICGFRRATPSPFGCGFTDTINVAWIADNDGKQDNGDPCPFTENNSLTSVTGARVVRTPSDSLQYSFNWWISNGDAASDFGPRLAGTPDDPFRDFGGFLGTPEGDRNKYYIMRHVEFDYDQLFSAKDNTSEGWLPPSGDAADFADGFDTRYLLSWGPFDIAPGEILPMSLAYIAGENLYTDCNAFRNLFNPSFPEVYYNYMNFEDLGRNSLWASWIYDNPGYDTDGDGYLGKYRICVFDSTLRIDTSGTPPVIETTIVYLRADTNFYEGDGVPDFRGASPPPPPVLRVFPRVNEFNEGEIRVRWNGFRSETEKDVFSGLVDFEGYRVYHSLSPKASDFVLVASYDVNDYSKYVWNSLRQFFELKDIPFSLDSLRALYGEYFDPLHYDRDNLFQWRDSFFYFIKKDWNASDLRDTTKIYKIYPDEPPPTIPNIDSTRVYYPEELTEEGYFKYYEYAYVMKHLLPSQLNYVSVTAFDYGAPGSGLESLESKYSANMVAEYAQNQNTLVESKGLEVVVYPNPYRIDANYRKAEGGGFEGRGQEDMADDRVRRIHFTNLPHKCKIRIFSIDGDLVREIDHDFPKDAPRSMHDEWDLITRNTQAAVSGIYYYVIESEYGNQIGKLVLIL
jgi:hypothetical protein